MSATTHAVQDIDSISTGAFSRAVSSDSGLPLARWERKAQARYGIHTDMHSTRCAAFYMMRRHPRNAPHSARFRY
jgi:hypothetical protein